MRSYLEEEVHVTAMESTTSELITKLEMLRDAGELKLDDDTIFQFQKILQTADLVKFAKSKPASSIAEQDRKLVEEIVTKTHEALPEPTEEDLLLDEEYLEELAKKNGASVSIGLPLFLPVFSFWELYFPWPILVPNKYGILYLAILPKTCWRANGYPVRTGSRPLNWKHRRCCFAKNRKCPRKPKN